MRVEVKCIASDGKVFDDEYDCKEYEYELLKKSNNVIMLDREFKKTDKLEYCYYCVVKEKEDLEKFKTLSDYEGLSCPNDVGAFYYDENYNSWFNLYDKVQNLKEELRNYENILNM